MILGVHDLERTTYFNLNPHWTTKAIQAMQYCISLARYHAAQGDYEISQAALNSLILINANYINAKGKTFFVNAPFFNHCLSHDGFISVTLEHFRKNVQIAISRGDEQQIEQTISGLEALCLLFLKIDYSTNDTIKTHTNLAAGYLISAVELILPTKMADVLMGCLYSLGNVARTIAILCRFFTCSFDGLL
ncbi:hypothetical protein Lrub_1475 [Legionella rubrilucens]|uniref:Uncharacterized protein n=2 Tax=Legionella rubrilucens TaxID=458 RepID=A0A0W0XUP1_9GAMM|nr:hypothetical protein [Legionella rubrilucens]KTD48146.1 hypothetical protein Lrub_1475 [Legionella rubrilucens]